MSIQQRDFTCQTCNSEAMQFGEIRKHLVDVHQSDGKGTKQMISHMDGRDWYGSVYRWAFGDVIVIESITAEREKDDPMRGDA